jgi:hypothetical protein
MARLTKEQRRRKERKEQMLAQGVDVHKSQGVDAVTQQFATECRPWWVIDMDVNRMNACADRYEVEVQCIYRVLRQFRNCGHGPSSQCACDWTPAPAETSACGWV